MQRFISESLIPLAAGLALGLLAQAVPTHTRAATQLPSCTPVHLELAVPVQLVLGLSQPSRPSDNKEFRGSART
jgi:hypothetical protein